MFKPDLSNGSFPYDTLPIRNESVQNVVLKMSRTDLYNYLQSIIRKMHAPLPYISPDYHPYLFVPGYGEYIKSLNHCIIEKQ